MDREDHVAGKDAERIPDYENEEAGRAEFEHEVEDLSFGDNVHAPKPKHRHPALFSAVTTLIVLLVLALGAGAWYMWQYHWRTLSIEVDGTAYSAKADTTVAAFMRDHRDFERKPGRLLSVEGKVLEPSGGNTVSVKFDGKQIEPADWDHTRFEKNGTLTVTPGTDLTEEHTVEQRKVPFKTDINLNGGPVQIVTQQGEDGLQEFWVGRQSKKTAAKTVIRKQEPLIVKSFAPRPEGKKVIALTFDDGPSIYSDKILDILKQNKVKATFFELGEQSLEFPKVEQRIVREGHQIASHSVSHPYFPNMSAQEQRQEIESSLSDIKKASDVSTRTFRAPYGAFGVDEWKNNATLIDRNVLWDVDTLDWKRPGEKQITKEVVDYVHNGAVVLMHSGGGDRSQTVKALPEIIKQLKKKGYSFVTIDELCKMAGLPEAEPVALLRGPDLRDHRAQLLQEQLADARQVAVLAPDDAQANVERRVERAPDEIVFGVAELGEIVHGEHVADAVAHQAGRVVCEIHVGDDVERRALREPSGQIAALVRARRRDERHIADQLVRDRLVGGDRVVGAHADAERIGSGQ